MQKKVFYKIRYPFMIKKLQRTRIFDLIKAIYENPTVYITLNGERAMSNEEKKKYKKEISK